MHFIVGGVKLNFVGFAQFDCAVLGVSLIVEKKILDYLSFVTEAKHKLIVAKRGVVLHQVPQDWQATY
jgi:hypothetical protein